jgi:hypothetical protein
MAAGVDLSLTKRLRLEEESDVDMEIVLCTVLV